MEDNQYTSKLNTEDWIELTNISKSVIICGLAPSGSFHDVVLSIHEIITRHDNVHVAICGTSNSIGSIYDKDYFSKVKQECSMPTYKEVVSKALEFDLNHFEELGKSWIMHCDEKEVFDFKSELNLSKYEIECYSKINDCIIVNNNDIIELAIQSAYEDMTYNCLLVRNSNPVPRNKSYLFQTSHNKHPVKGHYGKPKYNRKGIRQSYRNTNQ